MARPDPTFAGLKMAAVSRKKLKLTQTIKKQLTTAMLSQVEIGAIYAKKAQLPKHNLIQASRELCAIKIEQAFLPQQHHKS